MQHHSSGELADHLFRREAGKMIAMLTNAFGAHHLQLAEDIVQDTLVQACISWVQEIPPNPVAWLYRVARNKAIDALRRRRFSTDYDFSAPGSIEPMEDVYLMEHTHSDVLITDDMLRMMYACSHPAIAPEGATALILKTLCGFSSAEIANAFLTSEGTISKRLYRAKEVFRQQELSLSIPTVAVLQNRTDAVLSAIYLLFNQGYSASEEQTVIRADLMTEAMHLCSMLLDHPHISDPAVPALMALMCFHASRNNSRISPEGNIVLLSSQDRSLWDRGLIERGNNFLNLGARGDRVSVYHLQAAIAAEHCNAASFEKIDWTSILKYYDWLMMIAPSPVTALHRAVAVLYIHGAGAGTEAILCIDGKEILTGQAIYHAVLGECYALAGKIQAAAECYEKAALLTKVSAEKKLLEQKIAGLFN